MQLTAGIIAHSTAASALYLQCQSDRSQHRNRDQAMRMLRARLYELLLRQRYGAVAGRRRHGSFECTHSWPRHALRAIPSGVRREARAATEAARLPNAWGSQVRSYILHPYQVRLLEALSLLASFRARNAPLTRHGPHIFSLFFFTFCCHVAGERPPYRGCTCIAGQRAGRRVGLVLGSRLDRRRPVGP